MVPTKELVLSPWVDLGHGEGSGTIRQLVEDETRVWGEITALCDDLEIECNSVLGPLREAVRSGSNPFFADWDGHPSQLGHRVIARTVAASATVRSLPTRP